MNTEKDMALMYILYAMQEVADDIGQTLDSDQIKAYTESMMTLSKAFEVVSKVKDKSFLHRFFKTKSVIEEKLLECVKNESEVNN